MATSAGYTGQIRGPFGASENVLATVGIPTGHRLKFGVSIDPKDFMQIPLWGFEVDGTFIQMGKTCMYETDDPIYVSTLVFPTGAPKSTIVDFVVYN